MKKFQNFMHSHPVFNLFSVFFLLFPFGSFSILNLLLLPSSYSGSSAHVANRKTNFPT